MKLFMVLPMAVQFFYTFTVALIMFGARVRGIRSGAVPLKYYKDYQGVLVPEPMERIADHYQNQFEVPMLFFVTAMTCLLLDAVTGLSLILAWVFVGSRLLHGWIHLGANRVRHRAVAFFMGWIALVAMWVQLLAAHWSSLVAG